MARGSRSHVEGLNEDNLYVRTQLTQIMVELTNIKVDLATLKLGQETVTDHEKRLRALESATKSGIPYTLLLQTLGTATAVLVAILALYRT